ncbi:MAG: hypothetical protein JWL65_1499 [Gammaproteobacteria bacterium]|nr:hypothetical protein [Gammaproteobacteria bacterium]
MDEGFRKAEDRLAKVESDVAGIKVDVAVLTADVSYIKGNVSDLRQDVADLRGHQERDFRVLFGSLIFVALSLAGLIAKAFGWFH